MPATISPPASQPVSAFGSPEKRAVILCLLLTVGTLALYNSVAHHPFVNYDDDRYVTDNPQVQDGLTWATVRWAFTTTSESNWHPLTWLSHAMDFQVFRLNPAGHHYINLLLHAINAILLFLVLWRATGRIGPSWMVAALFAWHPINVETVAWIAERKNVLSMLFFLLALEAYRRYVEKPGAGRYSIVTLLFALGLMAKPQVITFPFVLLLWDYWPLGRMFQSGGENANSRSRTLLQLVLEKTPLFLLCVASSIITLKAQRAGGAVGSFIQYPFSVRLENALVAYIRYVGKAVWPWPLAPMYPHPENSLAAWQWLGALLLLAAITAGVLAARKQRYLALGWFWFLGTLVPMIGLVQVGSQAMADRYAYLTFIGLFIMACWGTADLTVSWKLAPSYAAIPGLAALIVLAAVTHRQLGFWANNVTLWSHSLAVTDDNFLAEDNLGGALAASGRVAQSIPHFQRAAALSPLDYGANLNLAIFAQAKGNLREAVERYNIVVRVARDDRQRSTAYSNLGFVYRASGDDDQARESYASAMRANPENVKPVYGMALLDQKDGDLQNAASYYARAVSLQPSDFGYLLLAQALEKTGHGQEAQLAYQNAQQVSPDIERAKSIAHSLLGQ